MDSPGDNYGQNNSGSGILWRTSQGYRTHYGITMNCKGAGGISGRFVMMRVENNTLEEMWDENIGIFIEGGGHYVAPRGAFNRLYITGNWITNYGYSFYTRRATSTAYDVTYYGLIINNKVHSPAHGWFGYLGYYQAYSNNKVVSIY